MYPKVVSLLAQPISFNFHIEISDDTIQSLNYVVDQLSSKLFSRLLNIFIYSFISMDFPCFVKKCKFSFLHLKIALNVLRSFCFRLN